MFHFTLLLLFETLKSQGFSSCLYDQTVHKLYHHVKPTWICELSNDKQLLTVVKDTLNSFAKSSEGLTLFATNSASGQHGRFQILPCTVKNGQVSLASITAYFEASQVSNDYFFFTYRSKVITMHKSSQVLTLDEEVYGKVRQEVIDKLGKNAYTFVKNLQI